MHFPPRAFAASCLILLALLSACSKKDGSAEEAADQAPSLRPGIVAVQDAPFYVNPEGSLAGDWKPEWKAALDFSTGVRLSSEDHPQSFRIGGETIELLPVELSVEVGGATRGWIRAGHFAGDGAERAVVVAAEALIREAPSETAEVIVRLPRASLLAAYRNGEPSEFLKVFVVDPVSQRPFESAYIEWRELSFSEEDLGAAFLMAKAAATRDEAEAKAFLETGSRLFPDAIFFEGSQAGQPGEVPDSDGGPAMEELSATLLVRSESARVLAAPAPEAEELALLKLDDEVSVRGRTAEQFELDRGTARWYRIESPAEGWIFGLDLEGAD